jgi:hypothetical protein
LKHEEKRIEGEDDDEYEYDDDIIAGCILIPYTLGLPPSTPVSAPAVLCHPSSACRAEAVRAQADYLIMYTTKTYNLKKNAQ